MADSQSQDSARSTPHSDSPVTVLNHPAKRHSLDIVSMSTHQSKTSLRERCPVLDRLVPEWAFNTFIAVFAEFMGTTFFLFFALAGCQVTHLSPTTVTFPGPAGSSPQTFVSVSSLLYAALAVGFSLAVNAWVFFRVTSALFNPAITLGMVFVGSLAWKRAACLAVSQMLGGMAAAGLVSCMFPGDIRATETLLGRETSVVRGFFIEVLLTAAFVFSVFMLAADKHKGTFIAPIGIGLALFMVQLAGGPFTGASVNPARSFGPAVASHHFPGYHWIYWIGPLLGSLLAAGFYKTVKILEVETALALRGGSFLGHHRGISHSSNVPADTQPKEVHVLDPVAESDLEKGLKAPSTSDHSAAGPAQHS